MPDTARCNLLANLDGHVKKLREAVLDMAIRGDLVSQRRPRPVAADPDGDPFSVPVGWKWVFAEDVFSSIADGDHQAPPKSDDGVPFLVIGNVCKGVLDFAETRFVSPAYFSKLLDSRRPQRGDLLYTVVGSFGIPVVVDSKQPFCVQRHIAILRPSEFLDVRYAAHLFRSPFVYGQANTCATGTAQKTVSLGTLRKFRLPLPPLAEQKRIVAKVDQLMALCDDLDAKQTKKRDLATQSTHSALTALTTAETAADLAAAWRRVEENPELLSISPELLNAWRLAILELLVDGSLWCDRGAGVTWPRASVSEILAESLANGRSVPDGRGGFPVLRLSAFRGRTLDYGQMKEGAWTKEQAKNFIVRPGDVFFVRGNGAIRLVGRACIADKVPVEVAFPDTAIRARLNPLVVDPLWLWHVWESPQTRAQIEVLARTTAGIFKVSQDDILAVTIPLPPLTEQRRIVAKVDHLMSLLGDLEAKLRKQEETATRLAESLAAAVAA